MRAWIAVLLVALPSSAHADLYLRFGAGPGLAVGSEDIDGAAEDVAAVDVSSEIAVGTHVRPDLVVGAGTFPMVVPERGQHLSATGPFVAWERGALYVQGGLLITAGYHEAKHGHDAAVGFGLGATAGVGYDLRRGARWSVGPLLRVTYYHWSGGAYAFDEVSPSVLVAVTHR